MMIDDNLYSASGAGSIPMRMLDPTETIKRTRFSVIRLPKTQRFACNKRDIQTVFSNQELDWVSIGLVKSLKLAPRYFPRPNFAGHVVADLSVGRGIGGGPSLSLFPVRIDQYPEEAAEEFKSIILPKMKEWLNSELTKPETSVFGHSELFVAEWTGSQHRCHQLRWR